MPARESRFEAPALTSRTIPASYEPRSAGHGVHDPRSEELALDLGQLMQMWLRRWRPAVACAILTGVAATVIGMSRPPIYAATAMVVVQGQPDIVPMDRRAERAEPDTSAVDTKVMLASSQALAERVVQREHLLDDPEFSDGTTAVLGGPQQSLAKVSNEVRRHLLVRRAGLTSAIEFRFQSENAMKAAGIANAFANEFINWGVDSRVKVNERSSAFINEHLNQLQREAEAAETAVQQYKIAHGLLSSAGETIAEQEVGTLSEQIAVAQADLAEREARLRAADEQAGRGGGNQDVSAALASNTISALRQQQAEATRRLAELRAKYGPKYPEVQKAEGDVKDISAKIQDEANRIKSSLASEVSASAQRLRSLRASQSTAQGALASNNRAEVGLLELERKAEASKQLYDAFLNRSKETSVQGSEQPDARVYDEASVPTRPLSPNPQLVGLIGFTAAIMGGGLALIVLELLDTSMRTSDDIVRRLGLPVIGIVPTPRSSEGRFTKLAKGPPYDYIVKRPFSIYAEAFRNIRVSVIMPDGEGRRSHVVAIASSVPREGKSTTAFCLMRALAMAGTSVVLVDCDLRRRGVSTFLSALEAGGIVEVLEGSVSVVDALVFDAPTGGWVLPVAGQRESNLDLFSSPEMDALLDDLASRFEVVLIDTPAVLAVADARVLAAKADAVIYVAQWAKTPGKAIEIGLDALSSVGANIAGVILNGVDLHRQVRSRYGDASSYYRKYAGYYQN